VFGWFKNLIDRNLLAKNIAAKFRTKQLLSRAFVVIFVNKCKEAIRKQTLATIMQLHEENCN